MSDEAPAEESGKKEPAYITMALPRLMVLDAEELIRAHPELGFRNRSELATEAFRSLVAELKRRVYYSQVAKQGEREDVPLRSRGGGFKGRKKA